MTGAPARVGSAGSLLRTRIRESLFGTWWSGALSLLMGAGFVWAAALVVDWAFLDADWEIVQTNLTLFVVGRFPRAELWRLWAAAGLVAVSLGIAGGLVAARGRDRAEEAGLPFEPTGLADALRRYWPVLALLAVLLGLARTWTPTYLTVAALTAGWGSFVVVRSLPRSARRFGWTGIAALAAGAYAVLVVGGGVPTEDWSGLHLNLYLTVAGIVLAFPLGLLFALGRRSRMPVVRTLSVAYIEFVRGVPLISLLLMGDLALGFFFPASLVPGRVTRALIAITLFEGAYVAEVVRGGLQAVPEGQREAAQALGLSSLQVNLRIVLPQALRAVIPAMVGQFISLYKDTTLVAIIGIFDVLSVAGAAAAQPEFLAQGLHVYTYPFVALLFWVGSYTMSREARRLERRLEGGYR